MSSLPDMVQALLDPETYPDASLRVTLVQTGISFIFLTGDYVYKVKKPVNVGYLDYGTLAKRHFYCQREVALNRRLCQAAYLGVVSITRNEGKIQIGGEGEVIEYAVKMHYLPQEKMLDVLLAAGQVSAEMIMRVARKIADFHKKAGTSAAINAFGSIDAIVTNNEENFSETAKYIGNTISRESYRLLKDYTQRFIETNADLFRKRVADGKIRDCHGDLHAAHICFTDAICIYDCIEFNDRFRYCDVASEIAFLAMDLDNYGRADLSRSFVDAYVSFSGDEELLKLLDFYKYYRAYVRGKVEGFKLDDPLISAEGKKKALAAAQKYFALAESYTKGTL